MNIAYIVLKGMPLGGGIEKYTEEIGSRLTERGHVITVYTMKHYGAKDGYYRGMKVRTIPTWRSRSIEKLSASFVATIKQCIEDNKTDIVHYHAFGPAMFSFIPRLFRKKVILQGHGIEWKRSKWGLAGKLFLRLSEIPSVRLPHAITVVSNVQRKYLKEKYGKESIYIPTGVNPPQIESPDLIRQYGLTGNDYVLFVGRLVREKGSHHLLEAYNKIKTDLKLVIAGDSEHEDEYKKELSQLTRKNKNIIFTGFVDGKYLRELFSNSYLFIQPSELEGLPTALLEAMSYGNCCLASDIPENREALNGHGYVFQNKNVEALAYQLNYLINNDEATAKVKDGAKKHVLQNHSWDDIADKFEQLYMNIIQNSIRK